MNVQTLMCVLLSLLVVCGCDGGGANPSDGPKLSISPSQLNMSFEKDLPQTGTLKVSVSGDTNSPAFVLVQFDGQVFENATINLTSSRSGEVILFPRGDLATNKYSGQNLILLCKDESCKSQYAGSPYKIPYNVEVKRGFDVSEQSLSFLAKSGEIPLPQILQVHLGDSQTDYNVNTYSANGWLTAAKIDGGEISVSVNTMRPGEYDGYVLVEWPGRPSHKIDVHYSIGVPVGGLNELEVTPSSVSLVLPQESAKDVTLTVQLPSWSSDLFAYINESTSWLSITTQNNSVTLRINSSGLSTGNFQSRITVQSDPDSTPIVIPISISVDTAIGALPDTHEFIITGETSVSDLTHSVAIPKADGAKFNWKATSMDDTLLRMDSPYGNQDEPITFTLMPKGVPTKGPESTVTECCYVGVDFPDTGIPAQYFKVQIKGSIPSIKYVGPYAQLAGQPLHVLATGENAEYIGKKGDVRLQIRNVQTKELIVPTNLQSLSGGIDIRLPELTEGVYSFSLPNELDFPVNFAKMVVKQNVDLTSSVINTDFPIGKIIYDNERSRIWLLDSRGARVLAYSLSGTRWEGPEYLYTDENIFDFSLTPDATEVYALGDKSLAFFDANSMTKVRLNVTTPFTKPNSGLYSRMAITGDGFLHYADSNTGLNKCRVEFDKPEIDCAAIHPTVYLRDGPWFQTSGNGARVYLQGGASYFTFKTTFYNAPSETWSDAVLGGEPNLYISASNHNEIVAVDSNVYNRETNLLIGKIPDTVRPVYLLQASPSGERLYALTYQYDEMNNMIPRVYVLNTDINVISQLGRELTVLGYFDLEESPTCDPTSFDLCYTGVVSAISNDGKTIFFAGEKSLVITTIPKALTPVSVAKQQFRSLPKRMLN